MSIHVLPPEVAARIAAGEVVERPASIVKELVENALDAGASRITIEVTNGGIESIRVSDDGCGIEPKDIEIAFARHATSKLENDADLARIVTLGFRGEALPSIAAVAEVEMISRPPHCDAATAIRLAPEVPSETSAHGAPAGTSITVRRLFARLPARRKFLRTATSESNAISAVVSHYALAYPEIRFSLKLDKRETLRTPGSGELRDSIAAVYGADLASEMLPLGTANGGPISPEGLISPPHVSRGSRNYMSLFLNRRWIQNRRLAYAVEEAYQGLLMTGRHPIAVLNLRMLHEDVDVNVHPTKSEVRFRDESAVFGVIRRAVREALMTTSPVPSFGVGPTFALAAQPTAPPLWEHGLRVEAAATLLAPSSRPAQQLAPATPTQSLPVLRVIGQLANVYVISEGPDGMYLIDQHAAHERVLYDAFLRKRRSHSPEVQGLLEPLTVELSSRHKALLTEESEALDAHGFQIEPFGEGAYLLRSLPRALADGDPRQAVIQFLDTMLEEDVTDGRDRVAMSLACHGAIRAGKTLAHEEMKELVRLLEESEAPNTCPHGRPTMLHMSAGLLAREFGRR